MMNQRQINAFHLVMRYGSITGAAKALNISQPAVSRLIADLEHSLGFPLLIRNGGRVTPTPDAHEFAQEVERMFYGLDRLALAAEEIRNLRRATLRIASLPMASFRIVPQTLSGFLARHRGIRITHDVHNSSKVLDLLASHQIDLGIAQIHADRQDLEVLAAYRATCVCVMRPDHPLASRPVLSPRDLDGEPLIALADHTLTASYVTQRFAEARIRPDILVETQPSYSACGIAALGLGIAIVDPITPVVYGDQLVSVPFDPQIPFDFQILKPSDVPLSRAATEFVQQVRHAIAALPDFGATVTKITLP